MKKLLALLLSVIMAMSLTAPAFADGPDGPAPEEAVPISALLPEASSDSSFGIIGGADGPTAIITTIPSGWANTNSEFDQASQEMYQAMIDAQKEALGGVPGQIGVMVNGEYIQFPDAAPEVTDGRTMVPVRALVETLGGEVDYQDDTVQFVIDGSVYEFVIGSATVTVSASEPDEDAPEETTEIEMDCVPYIKGGRTYVPIRFISEALGYEVGWDSSFQTAILLDREALAAEIDKDFTILNKMQASQTLSPGKTYSAEMKGSLTVTAFDTLNGDTTYTADLAGKTLLNTEAANGSYSITLSDDTVDALSELMGVMIGTEDTDTVRTILENLSMEVILTREGLMWAHAAILDELSGEKNVWFRGDMDAELAELAFSGTGAATVGSALAAMVPADSVQNLVGITEMVKTVASLYGDGKFTTSEDGVSTLTIGIDDLAALYADFGLDVDDVKDAFKEYSITMTVDSKGGAAVTCVMETAAQTGVPGISITIDCTQSGGKGDVTMEVHVANVGEAKLELTATQKTTSEKPMTEPPEEAVVVDSGDLTSVPALVQP